MNPLQIILDFFKEMVNRIGAKSPTFFKVLQVVGASLTFAGYLPSMLQQWFDVEVSGNMITLCEKIGNVSAGFFASSMLAAKSSTVGQTELGNIVKVTDEKKMPFTAAAEQRQAAKETPPPEVLPDVPEQAPEKIDLSKFPDTSNVPKPENKS